MSPGLVARKTLTVTSFLVQRRKAFKERTEHVAWGQEMWGGGRALGSGQLDGSPLEPLFPDVAPETTPVSWATSAYPTFQFFSKIVVDPNRIETLCLKHTSWHRTVSI